jgi:ankyrin repeat protein
MKDFQKNIKFKLLFVTLAIFTQVQINARDQQALYDVEKIVAHEIIQKSLQADELPLHTIILNQNDSTSKKLELMRKALNNGEVNVNAQDSDGKTALNLITFYNGDPDLAQLLIISYKADVNKPDRFNVSPLHNAIEKDEIKIAKMLLDAGADQTLKNDVQESTPVDLARSPNTKALFGLTQ